MAQRRMFSMKVVDTDAFCDMPASAQNLYFHIGMRSDDEGFYAGVRGLMAKIHASDDDLRILIARAYVLDRGDGVYVVKHWKLNNYLQNDRIKPTEYDEKKVGLYIKKDGSYTLDPQKSAIPVSSSIEEEPKCIQNVSIDKNSVDLHESRLESSLEENKKEESLCVDEDKKTREDACFETQKGNGVIYSESDFFKSPNPANQCMMMLAKKKRGEPISQEWERTLQIYEKVMRERYEDLPF